jgi:hypothetical protein
MEILRLDMRKSGEKSGDVCERARSHFLINDELLFELQSDLELNLGRLPFRRGDHV